LKNTGASGHGNTEAWVMWDFCRRVKRGMRVVAPRWTVHLTRPTKELIIPLQNRISLCRAVKADILVSCHMDAGPASARGPSAFYGDMCGSARLAGCIYNRLMQLRWYKPYGRGVHHHTKVGKGSVYILRAAPCPSALIELGFITNKWDWWSMVKSIWRRIRINRKVRAGIRDFFRNR